MGSNSQFWSSFLLSLWCRLMRCALLHKESSERISAENESDLCISFGASVHRKATYSNSYHTLALPIDTTSKSVSVLVLSSIELVSLCENPRQHFDNFLTSHHLLCSSKELGICTSGTIRKNRLSGATFPDRMARHPILFNTIRINRSAWHGSLEG